LGRLCGLSEPFLRKTKMKVDPKTLELIPPGTPEYEKLKKENAKKKGK